MLQRALPVPLAVQFGIVGQAELDSAADDGLGDDEAVGLGDEAAIQAARRSRGRRAVVLGGLRDGFDLFRGEPSAQARVGADDAAALEMVGLAVHRKPQVVAGRGGVQHVQVDVVGRSHGQRALYDCARVVLPVRLVKGGIAGNYLILNVLYKFRIHFGLYYRRLTGRP